MQGNLYATQAQENTQWGTGGGGGCLFWRGSDEEEEVAERETVQMLQCVWAAT